MKISKGVLQTSLEIVKPGLDNKEIISQSSSFAFMYGRVVTYNDRISVSHPVKEIDFEGAISSEELYGLLSRLNNDEVDVSLSDDKVLIKCGRMKAKLSIQKLDSDDNRGIKYVIDDQKLMSSKKWKKISKPDQFVKHLKFATQACSTDMTDITLTCVNVKKNGLIQSTDRLRLIQCKGVELPVDGFLIPGISVLEVIKINPNKISISNGWAHFKNEAGTIVSARTVGGDFFDQVKLNSILKVKGTDTIEFPEGIEEMLQRSRLFAKRDFIFDESVELLISGGKLKLVAISDKTKSCIEESAKIKYNKDISFWITPSLFHDILKETRICVLDKGRKKAKFKADDGNCEYVIVLGLGTDKK